MCIHRKFKVFTKTTEQIIAAAEEREIANEKERKKETFLKRMTRTEIRLETVKTTTYSLVFNNMETPLMKVLTFN